MSPINDDPFPNRNLGKTMPTNASISAINPGTRAVHFKLMRPPYIRAALTLFSVSLSSVSGLAITGSIFDPSSPVVPGKNKNDFVSFSPLGFTATYCS